MPSSARTVLMSTNPAEENWQPSFGKKVSRFLKNKASLSGFSVKVAPSQSDAVKLGAIKSSSGSTVGEARTGPANKHFFGIEYTKQF